MSQDGPFGPVVNGTQIVFFEYLPNKPAAISFVTLFGIVTLAHLIFIFIYRAWFFIPFVLGGICEIFGYFGRAQAHDTPDEAGPFILQNVLLLAGTPFLAATIYMSLRRVAAALDSEHLSFLSLRWFTKLYVLVDIGCIVSQFIGAIIPASGDADAIVKGRIILIAGLVVQLCALSIFIMTSVYLYVRIRSETGPFLDSTFVRWRRYFRTIEAVTGIMIVRSIVRAVEYLQGQDGFVISHEVFIYLFDASLMPAAVPIMRAATRQIHVTPRRFASADQPSNMNNIESMMNDPLIRDTFEKLSRHPPAIAAMQKMGEVIKSKGMDPCTHEECVQYLTADNTGLDASKPPSKMDLMKLMMDKEFRDASTELTTEMQNAGVEINPDVFMKMIQGEK
ncbi:hypothetical protein FSPOR_1168 [Fusarium sporotrichioides]|uniref:Uncharacterized protein n=1 Tax=Fusarium sporotrichioides TaxID=5514 RepID=A0A395SQ60_FUSSP|nr:hypothetical protein FSPOR_1168 [Fusarium sporotrichioides]